MFKLTYRPKHDRDHAVTEYFDDIKSLGQALINIVNNEKEENSAMDWCERANWGDKVVRQQFGYKIECFNEEELKNNIEETVVKPICKHFNIGYSFTGWDNDAMTWDLDADLSWIKFHDNYGYYFVMNKDNYPNGNTEIFSTTNKDKNKFISDVIVGLEKVIRNQMKKTSKTETAWHKMYSNGTNKKIEPNDFIKYYYRNDKCRINVTYTDWRHNKVCGYTAYDMFGNCIGIFPKLFEAQSSITKKFN